MTDDPYQILNLAPDATQDAVEKAYRSMASRWHPDLHPAARRTEAEEQMKRINAAAELLLNPNRRAAYDRERQMRASANDSDSPLADTTTCHLHPDRPRLHYCVCCRNAICAECTQIIDGWPWCSTCAATSQMVVSSAPVYGDNSVTPEWVRREQYQLSQWSKINLALSVIALALWLFSIWGIGFVYTPFAVVLVGIAVFAASAAFHFALLRATALFWNTRRTIPKFLPSTMTLCLSFLLATGGNSAYRALKKTNQDFVRETAAAKVQAQQQEKLRQEQKAQQAKQEYDQATAKIQKTLVEQFFLQFDQPDASSMNIDFTRLIPQNSSKAISLANEYLIKYVSNGDPNMRAMFLSFLVYLAIASQDFGEQNNLDSQANECLRLTGCPTFKIYCFYYLAERIDRNGELPLDKKMAGLTAINNQIEQINLNKEEQYAAKLREKTVLLLRNAQKKQEKFPKDENKPKDNTQEDRGSPGTSFDNNDSGTPHQNSDTPSSHPATDNRNPQSGGE